MCVAKRMSWIRTTILLARFQSLSPRLAPVNVSKGWILYSPKVTLHAARWYSRTSFLWLLHTETHTTWDLEKCLRVAGLLLHPVSLDLPPEESQSLTLLTHCPLAHSHCSTPILFISNKKDCWARQHSFFMFIYFPWIISDTSMKFHSFSFPLAFAGSWSPCCTHLR